MGKQSDRNRMNAVMASARERELASEAALRRVAESMGMTWEPFLEKYLNDAPFYTLAFVHRAALEEWEGLRRVHAIAMEALLEQSRTNFRMAAATIERRARREAEKDVRLERAERVEAAARKVADVKPTDAVRYCDHADVCDGNDRVVYWLVDPTAMANLRAALAPAPGEGADDG